MLAFCFLCAFCFLIGFLIGRGLTLKQEVDTSNPSNDNTLDPTKTYWKIVRYRKGTKDFDCIWEKFIYDKRVADKICANLNDPNGEDNAHLYGDYYVEKM